MEDDPHERDVEKYLESGDPNHLFKRLEIVGHGSFARVFKSLNVVTREIVAVKVINLENVRTSGELADLQNEIFLLSQCQHGNIVQYSNAFVNGTELLVAMEFLGGGTLKDLLLPGRFPDLHVRVVLREVLMGLEYLHSNMIIHRDIKARNIIISEHGDVKLVDFGVAVQLASRYEARTSMVGTPCYMAPEVIAEDEYSFGADIWSVGVLAFELLTGNAPYDDLPAPDAMSHILYYEPAKLPNIFPRDLQDFVGLCMKKNQRLRPRAVDMLTHPCFDVSEGPEILMDLIDEYQQWKGVTMIPTGVKVHLPQVDPPSPSASGLFWHFDTTPAVSPSKPSPLSSKSKEKRKGSSTALDSSFAGSEETLTPKKEKTNRKKSKRDSLNVSMTSIASSMEGQADEKKKKRKKKEKEGKSPLTSPGLDDSLISIATADSAVKDRKRKKSRDHQADGELDLAKRRRKRSSKATEDGDHITSGDPSTHRRRSSSKTAALGNTPRGTSTSSMCVDVGQLESHRVSSPDIGGATGRISEDVVDDRESDQEEHVYPRKTSWRMSMPITEAFDEDGRRISRASCSYQARRDRELSFIEGSVVKVNLSKSEENGLFVEAEVDGRVGLVPAALVSRSLSMENVKEKGRLDRRKTFEELLVEAEVDTIDPPPKARRRRSLIEVIRSIFR